LAALLVVPVLFITGSGLAYRFLSPVVMRFFLRFASGDGIQPLWGFREYLAVLYGLMLAAGLLHPPPQHALVDAQIFGYPAYGFFPLFCQRRRLGFKLF
jgi:hypothetical protein